MHAEFTDADSGTTFDRPGLTEAFDAVAMFRPEVIVLHDADRLGCELVAQAVVERELTYYGARIEYV